MTKTRILVFKHSNTGIGKFREYDQYRYIAEHYGDEFTIDIDSSFPNTQGLERYFSDYDIVCFHQSLDVDGKLLNLLKLIGKKTIIDTDDYWHLGIQHPLNRESISKKWPEVTMWHLKNSDYVTTTTEALASKIRELNDNVTVIENAIDPTEEQFQPVNKPCERLRVGFICGSTHLEDIKQVGCIASKLSPEVRDKVQFVLCGFDTRGIRTIFDENTGVIREVPMKPSEGTWAEYERIITDNYSILPDDYTAYLKKYTKAPFEGNESDELYRRFWTKDIDTYATHYNDIDVLLAPLYECDFNRYKSELKAVECGFMNKVIIAQNFGPYKDILTPAIKKGGEIDPNGNALLVDSSKNHKQWAKYVERLVKDKELYNMLRDNLHRDMVAKYSIDKIAEKRVQLFRNIVNKDK